MNKMTLDIDVLMVESFQVAGGDAEYGPNTLYTRDAWCYTQVGSCERTWCC